MSPAGLCRGQQAAGAATSAEAALLPLHVTDRPWASYCAVNTQTARQACCTPQPLSQLLTGFELVGIPSPGCSSAPVGVLLGWAVQFHHGRSLTPPPPRERGRKCHAEGSRAEIRMGRSPSNSPDGQNRLRGGREKDFPPIHPLPHPPPQRRRGPGQWGLRSTWSTLAPPLLLSPSLPLLHCARWSQGPQGKENMKCSTRNVIND